jgi:hypothetical protein
MCSKSLWLMLILLALAACTTAPTPSARPDNSNSASVAATLDSVSNATLSEKNLSQVMLQVEDLPSGWNGGEVNIKNAPDAIGRITGFHGTTDSHLTWVNVVQRAYLYTSVESASAAYDKWFTQETPALGEKDGWQFAPHLEFPNQANQVSVACLPVYINGAPVDSCRAIAQYQNVITIIYGNLTADRWLTSEGFRNVLMAMDRRIVEVSKSHGSP